MAALRFVFSSDLHGVPEQYERLFAHATSSGAHWVFLGGDLHPDGPPDVQMRFARAVVLPVLERHRARLAGVAAVFGNHEWLGAEAPWRERPDLVHLLHRSADSVPVDAQLRVAGCPYTPFSPWYMKDFERWDLQARGAGEIPEHHLVHCLRTIDGKPGEIRMEDIPPVETMVAYMDDLATKTDPARTVYLIHAPPHDTPLDLMYGHRHVGSRAVTQFCRRHHPYLTLHGHIHETVELSGAFRISWDGGTSASCGNHPRATSLSVVQGDLHAPETWTRATL